MDDVDDAAVVLFVAQALKHKEVTLRPFMLDKVVLPLLSLDHQRVSALANFAFERLPKA